MGYEVERREDGKVEFSLPGCDHKHVVPSAEAAVFGARLIAASHAKTEAFVDDVKDGAELAQGAASIFKGATNLLSRYRKKK